MLAAVPAFAVDVYPGANLVDWPDVTDGLGGPEQALKLAMEFEKDSIVFYLGMRDAVPEKLGRDRLDGVIKEEMGHIRLLSRELIAHKS